MISKPAGVRDPILPVPRLFTLAFLYLTPWRIEESRTVSFSVCVDTNLIYSVVLRFELGVDNVIGRFPLDLLLLRRLLGRWAG